MRNVALILATVASVGAAYFVGVTYSDQRGTLKENLCLTNRTLVRTLEQNLAQTTASDLQHFGISNDRWETIRRQEINTIYAFRDASPCTITVQIPPDIVKQGG